MRARETRVRLADTPSDGKVALIDVGGQRVGLYRVDGHLHALADRCPHRGAPLCAGLVGTPFEMLGDEPALGLPRSVVRCPWHKWEFDIRSGRCLVDPKLRARRYAVRVDGDEAVVSLDRPS